MKKKIIIIGSGFSSLSASCYLAKAGYDVSILEKNSSVGGRVRLLNIRLFTIPVEDAVYAFNMLYPSILLIEFFKKKFNKKTVIVE
ncbi:MAG: NAD(P)-binding protein [Lutibacter sp.]|nr:NAD(P)-binding protein [Lutibacter sp.]MDP2068309.1 NAD(P)-binding protein [Lutibacter sp.]